MHNRWSKSADTATEDPVFGGAEQQVLGGDTQIAMGFGFSPLQQFRIKQANHLVPAGARREGTLPSRAGEEVPAAALPR